MKQIKLNKVTYSIPTGWNEVSIRQQMNAEELSDAQLHVKSLGILSAYTTIPIDILKHQKTSDLADIMTELSFIDIEVKTEAIFKFDYKDSEYSIAESLIKSEFQDYIAAQTAMIEFKDNKWKQLSYLVAIMAKKAGQTLDDIDLNKQAEYFMDLDVQTVSGIAFFLTRNARVSETIGVLFSPETINLAVQSKLKELDNSLQILRAQRGRNLLIRLWIWMSRKYIHFISYQLLKSLNTPVSSNLKKNWIQTCKRLLWKKRNKNNKS